MKNLFLLLIFSFISIIVLGQNADKPLTDIELDESTKEKYVGKYQHPFVLINILVDESNMFVQVTGQSRNQIIPFEENKFLIINTDATITFNLDENGNVESLIRNQNGMEFQARKVYQLDQVELFKKNLGKWRSDLGDGLTYIGEDTAFGNGFIGKALIYKNDSLVTEENNISGYDSNRDKIIDVSISSNGNEIRISTMWFITPTIMVRQRSEAADFPEAFSNRSEFDYKIDGTCVQTV